MKWTRRMTAWLALLGEKHFKSIYSYRLLLLEQQIPGKWSRKKSYLCKTGVHSEDWNFAIGSRGRPRRWPRRTVILAASHRVALINVASYTRWKLRNLSLPKHSFWATTIVGLLVIDFDRGSGNPNRILFLPGRASFVRVQKLGILLEYMRLREFYYAQLLSIQTLHINTTQFTFFNSNKTQNPLP